jgi:hypothetical protein
MGRRPGAEGVFYTGGSVDAGLRCSHCHIDNAKQQGKLTLAVTTVPKWQTASGNVYKPGTAYDITVELVGEHLGDGTDNNGMTASIEKADGFTAGVLVADVGGRSDSEACQTSSAPNPLTTDPKATETTVVFGDCRAILSVAHATQDKARTKWHFRWIAPAAMSGDVKLFIAAVDGDKLSSSSLNDDVVEGVIVIKEGK